MENLCARETETAFHLSDERYCRERARLFRKTAVVMANTVSRRLLLDLAEECDDIADDLVRSRFCGASQRLG
jgi:hypothetical protein